MARNPNGGRHRARQQQPPRAGAEETGAVRETGPGAPAATGLEGVLRGHLAARPWLRPLALGLLVLASYLPAMLARDFVWDDVTMIGSTAVREPGGLRQIWFAPGEIPAEGHYWPLTYTGFWLQHKLWGARAAGFHVLNVLLHLANTLLLWRLLRREAVAGAWLAAAVFALHPVHVESVAWIIELKDVLSGLFYLLAAAAWIGFADSPRPGRYLAALALYVAGMLSKSVVVTLPVALLIRQWWKRGRVTATDLLRVAPFFVVGAAIAAGDLVFNRSRGVGGYGYSLVERVLIAARAGWFYLGKIFWPLDLGYVYPHWEVGVGDPLAWAGLAAAVGAVAALWLLRDRIGRGPLAGVLFFAVTLAPTLGFVDYHYMLFSFVADRFQYLASIGVLALVTAAAAQAVSAGRRTTRPPGAAWSVLLAVALLGVLGTLTWRQAALYHDGITFFRHVIAHNPQARDAHLNLGTALLRWNRLEESLAAYRVAEEQRPDDCKPPYGAGLALHNLGRLEEAGDAYLRAVERCRRYGAALTDFAELLLDQQRYQDALERSQAAIEAAPRNAEAWTTQGRALLHLGRTEQALRSLDRALAIDPNQRQAREARAQLRQGASQDGR